MASRLPGKWRCKQREHRLWRPYRIQEHSISRPSSACSRSFSQKDRQRLLFGSKMHDYKLNPPIELSTIEQFEARHGISLPGDYRLFITEIGNGGAGPYDGLLPFGEAEEGRSWEESYLIGDVSQPFPHIDASDEGVGMLNAYYGEFNKRIPPTLAPNSLDELYQLIDRLAAARPVSSYGRGMSGDHAWIIVSDHGFDLSAYFSEDCREEGVVWFVLYGPYSPGDGGNIYDGRGLHGVMSTACLKGLLALMDEGRSPLDYVRKSAREADVLTD